EPSSTASVGGGSRARPAQGSGAEIKSRRARRPDLRPGSGFIPARRRSGLHPRRLFARNPPTPGPSTWPPAKNQKKNPGRGRGEGRKGRGPRRRWPRRENGPARPEACVAPPAGPATRTTQALQVEPEADAGRVVVAAEGTADRER